MISSGITQSALLDFLRGVHHEGDTYALALIRSDHRGDFDRRIYSYAQLGADEVDGEGYMPGGAVLQDYFATTVGDAAMIGWAPVQWPVATISAAGALLYNRSKEGRVLQVIAFERIVSSTEGPFCVDLKPTGQIHLRLEGDANG